MVSALQYMGITPWVLRCEIPQPKEKVWINVDVQTPEAQRLLDQMIIFITNAGFICTQEKPDAPCLTIKLPNLQDLLNNPQRKKQVYLECIAAINAHQQSVDLP